MLSLLIAQTPLPYTTVLANDIQYGVIDVSEQQEPTYLLEPTVDTAGSTRTITSPEEVEYHPVKGNTPSEQEVIDKILKAFPDAPIMVEVARCESELNPFADRENLGVDVGLFQINQVHLDRLDELGLDRFNMDDNIAYARLLYDNAGTQPWYMSKDCWAKHLA